MATNGVAVNLVNLGLVVGAGVVLVLTLASGRLSSWSLPAPLLAVAVGAAIGPHALEVLPFDQLAEYRDPLLEGSTTGSGSCSSCCRCCC